MKKILSEVLEQLAPSAVIDTFASYGMRLEEESLGAKSRGASIVPKSRSGDAIVAGVIGFTGDALRGTLLLATTFDVVANARPSEIRKRPLSKDSASDWILARDWVGELANQTLGRMKNRLRSYGIAFDVSPPTALSGPALTFAAPKGPSPRHHVFGAGRQQQIWFCFDAFYDPRRQVQASDTPDSREGSIIVFE